MKKPHIYNQLKENTDLDMKLKMFISSSCSCTTDFISEKVKSDIHLLLLPSVTNFIQLMLLCYNFYKRKSKPRSYI